MPRPTQVAGWAIGFVTAPKLPAIADVDLGSVLFDRHTPAFDCADWTIPPSIVLQFPLLHKGNDRAQGSRRERPSLVKRPRDGDDIGWVHGPRRRREHKHLAQGANTDDQIRHLHPAILAKYRSWGLNMKLMSGMVNARRTLGCWLVALLVICALPASGLAPLAEVGATGATTMGPAPESLPQSG